MKRKNLLTLMLLLTAGSISTELVAQQNLEALIKKYEDLDLITKYVVSKKNPETKKLENTVISFVIKYNKDFFKEVAAAFKKDEEHAIEAVESKTNNESISLFYKFEHVSYYIDGNSNRITVSVIKKNKKNDNDKDC